jgi:hypothetical protein
MYYLAIAQQRQVQQARHQTKYLELKAESQSTLPAGCKRLDLS